MKNDREIKRRCQSCRKVTDRKNLIKITKLPDGSLKINPSEKEIGRSLYVCNDEECIKILIKKKKIRSALKYANQTEIERIEKILAALKTRQPID